MNILVITPIYPGQGIGNTFTKVVHYFTKEWVAEGVNVRVIALPSYFPKFMYSIPTFFVNLLQKAFFCNGIPTQRNSEIVHYTHENVPVFRVPLFKRHPWAVHSMHELERALNEITEYLKQESFVPDVIAAHWVDPTAYFVDKLKQHYGCKVSMVAHGTGLKFKDYTHKIDVWGYRNFADKAAIEKVIPEASFQFRCNSGIPSIFFENRTVRNWSSVSKFIYVGMLTRRKYPDVVIDALNNNGSPFSLKIVGDGGMRSVLDEKIKRLKLDKSVMLMGRVDRTEIISMLDQSDVFIMISEAEVFGLVYIEAMARGCIVVASSGEGMEGIIESGKNGFLTKAGDGVALSALIQYIQSLSPKELDKISKAAMATAERLTDKKVALEYLSELKKVSNG